MSIAVDVGVHKSASHPPNEAREKETRVDQESFLARVSSAILPSPRGQAR